MIAYEYCASCGACYTSCPVAAIEMKTNQYGFYAPVVDETKCIKCGKCDKVCIVKRRKESHEIVCRAVRTKNPANLVNASSGGIFKDIAINTLSEGGVVYGAVFDDDFSVKIDSARLEEHLTRMQGAKYVQSKAWLSYKAVERDLKDGKKVLFTGTPCQISALKNFLHDKTEKLLCVEIGCHGVPSYTVFNNYLHWLSVKYGNGAEIESYSFRCKNGKDNTISWKNYCIKACFSDGNIYTVPFREDPYMKAFFNDLSINHYCYNCNNKVHESQADITIADFWGIQSIRPELDDDKGTSLVVIHTEKGKNLFERLQFEFSEQIDSDIALGGNKFINVCPAPHQKQEIFWKNFIEGMSLEKNVAICTKRSISERIASKLTKLVHKK